MNVIIVDDDLEFAQKLERDVINYFGKIYKNLTVCLINTQFKKIFNISAIDILFLDIDLKIKYNGIYLAKYIKSRYPKIIIVFVSFHEDFVFSALSVGFFQFIRKAKYKTDTPKVLRHINKYLSENNKKIIIKLNGRQYCINCSEIQYIVSIGHSLCIKTIDNDFTISQSLKKFMTNINYAELVQIERNLAINLNYTKKVIKSKVTMLNDDEYVVGRKYQNTLINIYEEFLIR